MIFLAITACVLYLLAAGWRTICLFRPAWVASPAYPWDLWYGAVAVVLHTVSLATLLLAPTGWMPDLFSATSFAAGLVAGLFILSCLTRPLHSLGIVVFPLAAMSVLTELNMPSSHTVPPLSVNAPLLGHILASMLAYAVLSLAAAQAILLTVQDQCLRRHRPNGFIRSLPPLQTMESVLFELIVLGFMLLSLALLLGLTNLHDMFAQQVAHKTILSVLAWVVFAGLLWRRWQGGWRGHTAIRWTLSGFSLLLLAYFGSKVVLELIL